MYYFSLLGSSVCLEDGDIRFPLTSVLTYQNYIAHYIMEYQNLIYTYATKSAKLSFPISDNTDDNNKDVQTFVSFVLKNSHNA